MQLCETEQTIVMTMTMRISGAVVAKAVMSMVPLMMMAFVAVSQDQISYNWEGSKEGWVPASENNLGCNLIEQPEAMAMRAFNTTPVMRSGTLSESLGIEASDYDRIQITLKNPTSSGNPNARLFAYGPESNAFMCHWNVPVDTSMTEFQTYTLDLTTPPNDGSGTFEGEVARFGWRGPWGVANGDTIYWKSMVIYNALGCTNADACNYEPLAEIDNGACVLVGDSCDDGNPATLDDMINADCLCSGQVDEIREPNAPFNLDLGPNPTSNALEAHSAIPLGAIRILDSQGKVCLEQQTSETRMVLDVSGFVPGLYFFEASSNQARVISRFIVQRP